MWKIASTTSRSKIINAPARGIFRMLEIYREHISFTVYYCASGTDGNQMLNVVQRGKSKCLLLELNLYIILVGKRFVRIYIIQTSKG